MTWVWIGTTYKLPGILLSSCAIESVRHPTKVAMERRDKLAKNKTLNCFIWPKYFEGEAGVKVD